MKKFALFCAIALLLPLVNTGCATNGGGGGLANWCRGGSLFPTTASRQQERVIMMSGQQAMARSFANCDPCAPVMCNPCEPAMCHPCEPVCNPCAHTGFMFRGPMPGPRM